MVAEMMRDMFKQVMQTEIRDTPMAKFYNEAITYYSNERQASSTIPPHEKLFPYMDIEVSNEFWSDEPLAVEAIHSFVDCVIKVYREIRSEFGDEYAMAFTKKFSFKCN